MVPTPTSPDCLSEILKAQMQLFDSPALTVKQHSPTEADPVASVEMKHLDGAQQQLISSVEKQQSTLCSIKISTEFSFA